MAASDPAFLDLKTGTLKVKKPKKEKTKEEEVAQEMKKTAKKFLDLIGGDAKTLWTIPNKNTAEFEINSGWRAQRMISILSCWRSMNTMSGTVQSWCLVLTWCFVQTRHNSCKSHESIWVAYDINKPSFASRSCHFTNVYHKGSQNIILNLRWPACETTYHWHVRWPVKLKRRAMFRSAM